MIDVLPCTTQAKRLRHLSTSLTPARGEQAGRTGTTLCGADAMDEENANWWLARYSRRRVRVATLPPCSKCTKAIPRVAEGRGLRG